MKACRLALLVVVSSLLVGCGVVTDPADVTPEVYVETPEPDRAAAAVFGQERIDEAFTELTAFAVAEAFPEELLDPQQQEFGSDQLADEAVLERLTPEAAEAWRALVDAALGADTEAADEVRTMRYYNVDEPSWTLPEDGPVVLNQQITDPEIDLDSTGGPGQELLVISFDHDATLAFTGDEEPVRLEVEKEMTFRLTPAPVEQEPSWLIEQFNGDYDQSELD